MLDSHSLARIRVRLTNVLALILTTRAIKATRHKNTVIFLFPYQQYCATMKSAAPSNKQNYRPIHSGIQYNFHGRVTALPVVFFSKSRNSNMQSCPKVRDIVICSSFSRWLTKFRRIPVCNFPFIANPYDTGNAYKLCSCQHSCLFCG